MSLDGFFVQDPLQKLLYIAMRFYQDGHCPGHVASSRDPKVCAKCGVHIDELRPPAEVLT